jgi:DNA polymerase III epsilon subunit-like protein
MTSLAPKRPLDFWNFKTSGEAFFELGRHAGCDDECCVPRIKVVRSGPPAAPALPPELMCTVAEPDPDPPLSPVNSCSFAVFDTETTGLSAVDVVLQCALVLFDEQGNVLEKYDKIWNLPPGTKISSRAYRVHKIGYKRINAVGLRTEPQLRTVLATLQRLRERKVPIVAHNASFDCRLLRQTAERHGVHDWDFEVGHALCTMRRALPFTTCVSSKTNKAKPPSNTELYVQLYKTQPNFGTLHDALTDCRVTAMCYLGGRKRGWWN